MEEGKTLGEAIVSHFLKPDMTAPPCRLVSASAQLRMRTDDFTSRRQLRAAPMIQTDADEATAPKVHWLRH